MRLLYGSFRNLLTKRKDYWSATLKSPATWKNHIGYLVVCDPTSPNEYNSLVEKMKHRAYGRFENKYVNKMWLDPNNWKIAYDVWMSKGKECNKFSIQVYHKMLQCVIPYLQKVIDSGKSISCADLIMYSRSLNPDWKGISMADEYRVDEFMVAAMYDMQIYNLT